MNGHQSIDFLRDYGTLDGEYLERLWREIGRLRTIEAAALNLINVKGRYHSEIAMKRLMEVCGK